jgi:hypothetical protein
MMTRNGDVSSLSKASSDRLVVSNENDFDREKKSHSSVDKPRRETPT